ncbi:hypothetical protein AMECASPLE_028933, partial [Ameca splendens]
LTFLDALTHEQENREGQNQENLYAFTNTHLISLPVGLALLPFLQWFPVPTACISCYIQSMNTRSQQVWTQLLNSQPAFPIAPFLLCLSFSTLNSPSSPILVSSLTPLSALVLPSMQFSLQRFHHCCRCSLCSTFIKGLSSDSPSYNT